MHLRSPLSHARGLGSAKEGAHHWWLQRLTAVALVPLVLWFAISMVWVARADYDTVVHWIGNPFNTAMLVLFLFASFYHATLGLQVVIEDYVHEEGAKIIALIVMKFVLVLLGAVSILAVLRIFASGG
jgi:succinate dehydrogenase / fumarate reductase membrane anchor subunit